MAAGAAAQGRGGRGDTPSAPVVDPQSLTAQRYADQLREVANQLREVERATNQVRGGRTGGPSLVSAGSDPLGGPVVPNAPYSADAVTRVTQVLGDGTRIEQSVTAKFYRDSAGRVRREQTIMGLTAEPQTTITVDPDPGDGSGYLLEASTRTARRTPLLGGDFLTGGGVIRLATPTGTRVLSLNGEPGLYVSTARLGGVQPQVPAGVRPVEESLGTRQIEGVKATGRKTTTTIPAGQIGNDRPIQITDERWESPELRLLLFSRHHDPRASDVEYQLTNINRTEPPPDLFIVPSDYTIVGAGERGAGARGGRGN